VAQIVQARTTPTRRRTDARAVDEFGEGVGDVVGIQASAADGHEKAGRGRCRAPVVAVAFVVAQRGDSAGVQEYLTEFAELGVSHHQHAGVHIDVVTIKVAGLAFAQAGYREQSDQRLPCGGS
jgi:hypothetical protein